MNSIWIDADACPRPVKEVVFRASNRLQIPTFLVANSFLRKPNSPFINVIHVKLGFDRADHEILKRLKSGDLVVTHDVPLAAEVVELGGYAINPRGIWYDKNSIGLHLSQRNNREELRDVGVVSGGSAPFTASDTRAFARILDKFLVTQR